MQRDSKRCLRCAGGANRVHHRSYDAEVMLGNDYTKLASVCDGCHTIIHFDESGKRYSMEETDRILLERDEGAAFPIPTVDLRKGMEYPAEWKRMTAVQRLAWNQEYNRLKILHWVRIGKNATASRKLLHQWYGMDDRSIDLEVAILRKRKRTTKKQKQ